MKESAAPLFGTAARRLAGLTGRLFGWRPQEFWQATPAELQRVVRAQIRPAEATVVVVGDAKKLEAKLRAVSGLPAAAAPPQYRDLDGHLKPGRPTAP